MPKKGGRKDGWKTVKEYLDDDGGVTCPWCGSNDITGDSVDYDSDCIFQTCRCGNCQAVWSDQYKLYSYQPITKGVDKGTFELKRIRNKGGPNGQI